VQEKVFAFSVIDERYSNIEFMMKGIRILNLSNGTAKKGFPCIFGDFNFELFFFFFVVLCFLEINEYFFTAGYSVFETGIEMGNFVAEFFFHKNKNCWKPIITSLTVRCSMIGCCSV
jgi:hypothetical protein